jgi:Ni/Fe-hydrogenase subunit HybB-like protein
MEKFDAIHLQALFSGHHAMMFWLVQLAGLIIPIFALLYKPMRQAKPLLIISIFVLIGAWFKRYLIVVPTQEHPFLPIQNVPDSFKIYVPTLTETLITIAPIIMVILIFSTLAKFFPVLPIAETIEEKENETHETAKNE